VRLTTCYTVSVNGSEWQGAAARCTAGGQGQSPLNGTISAAAATLPDERARAAHLNAVAATCFATIATICYAFFIRRMPTVTFSNP